MRKSLGGNTSSDNVIFRSRIPVPVSFRPEHQTDRVLAHVEAELDRRLEFAERRGNQLVIAGVIRPGWNARFSGRGILEFQRHPAPGHFVVRVTVVREALLTLAVFVGASALAWIAFEHPTSEQMLITAAFALGSSALWAAWGLHKLLILRRMVQRGITRVAT